MDPDVRLAVEPDEALMIEVEVSQEFPGVDEVLPHVADRPLHLALGLRPVRPARPRGEVPVGGEAEELRVVDERAAVQPEIFRDDRFHLVEEKLLWNAAEVLECLFEANEERPHVLAREEAEPEKPREGENDEEREPLPKGETKLSEVDLRLLAGRCLEADHRLRLGSRPHGPHILLELCVAAGVTRGPDFIQESYRRELRVTLEPRADD